MVSTIGSFILGASALVLVANVLRSLRAGVVAGDNPWSAWTLEWATTSPPPPDNFHALPPIRSRRPLWDIAYPATPDGAVGPDEAFPASRPPASKVAVFSFIGSEAAFFVLLIIAYIFYDSLSQGGPSAQSSLDRGRTGVLTVLLLASSGTLHLAEKSHDAGRRGRSHAWLAVTIALGLTFLVGQVTEYYRMFGSGIRVGTNLFATTFFTLTGFHGLHVLGGLVALSILLGLALRGKLRTAGLRGVGYYWHFVDVVWIVVFSVVYLRGAV
jgi:heme/copper-type cytochrome/quinol oxidase subunit 3